MTNLLLFLACVAVLAGEELPFAPHTIAGGLRGGYQVVAADFNRDGRPDLLVVASGLSDLFWFENPGSPDADWKKHLVHSGFSRLINAAVHDLDGDGIPEIALAGEFSMDASKSAGIVYILRSQGKLDEPWTVVEIDRLSTSHRLRWADLDSSGTKVLINAPLTNAEAKAPLYEGATPLVYYRPGEWKREWIDDKNQGVVHGILVDGSTLLTASFSGLHSYRFLEGEWHRAEIAKGDPGECPKCGTSDVAVGALKAERFYATIEPWHGSQVVVYQGSARRVIDTGILDGHTIETADFDGDGDSEIIAGYRGQGVRGGLILYRWEGGQWQRQVLDANLPAAGCAIADLNGDKAPDVVCIGSSTATLRWFENRSRLKQ